MAGPVPRLPAVERATAMSSAAARLIEVVVTGLVVVLVMSLS